MRQMTKPSSQLFGLDACLLVSVAIPGDDDVSSFTPDSPDRLYGDQKHREVYALWSGGFEGRASVPMLWDAECRQVVCNESIEILKLLCDPAGKGNGSLHLWPLELRQYIDRWYGVICPSVSIDMYRYIRNWIPLQHCLD
jgi:putative glutathione S-transferase